MIISEGVRLHADLYYPAKAAAPMPAIVMSHGWGGTAAMLRTQATAFAQVGYFVVVFDYRGWGKSQSRVMQAGPATSEKGGDGTFSGTMRELREVVDPLDQAMDLQNAVHWAMGEPAVDKTRVGLWGTSFSGGLVVHVAAHDPRVRALVSQVGYLGQPLATAPASALEKSYGEATRRARGELGYPPPVCARSAISPARRSAKNSCFMRPSTKWRPCAIAQRCSSRRKKKNCSTIASTRSWRTSARRNPKSTW